MPYCFGAALYVERGTSVGRCPIDFGRNKCIGNSLKRSGGAEIKYTLFI